MATFMELQIEIRKFHILIQNLFFFFKKIKQSSEKSNGRLNIFSNIQLINKKFSGNIDGYMKEQS